MERQSISVGHPGNAHSHLRAVSYSQATCGGNLKADMKRTWTRIQTIMLLAMISNDSSMLKRHANPVLMLVRPCK